MARRFEDGKAAMKFPIRQHGAINDIPNLAPWIIGLLDIVRPGKFLSREAVARLIGATRSPPIYWKPAWTCRPSSVCSDTRLAGGDFHRPIPAACLAEGLQAYPPLRSARAGGQGGEARAGACGTFGAASRSGGGGVGGGVHAPHRPGRLVAPSALRLRPFCVRSGTAAAAPMAAVTRSAVMLYASRSSRLPSAADKHYSFGVL